MTREATSISTSASSGPPHPAQRRILTALVLSQILSGAGLAAGITVGALLAQDMLHSTSLAGLPSALFTAGSALAAVGIGRLSHLRGRAPRPACRAGYLTAAIGSAGVIAAAVAANPVLLFAALFVYGAGSATNLQARYAGADLAAPARRGRAVSTVLVASTLGGVIGPNLGAPTGTLATTLGIPAAGRAVPARRRRVRRRRARPDPLATSRPTSARPCPRRPVPSRPDRRWPGRRSVPNVGLRLR
ncbi:MFS transporter [Fodinicola feengrottensis]|uniref:hypothetical protein n=1 Tax=Fodinicola feengrottensis TaxID=435914 RepID=UPI0028BF2C3D|nr:hypothetical protein [Fodinicola feengrottensis]